MERMVTDTKEEYQISTRSGGHYQRILQKSLRNTTASKSSKSTINNNNNTNSRHENQNNEHQLTNENNDVKLSNLATDETSTPPPDDLTGSGNISSNEESSESTTNKFQCSICNKISNNEGDYLSHIRQHGSQSPNSGGDTATQSADHVNIQTFLCSICQKVFGSGTSLDHHILTHSNNEQPLQCKVCSVTFATNENLHRHMDTHNSDTGNQSEYESDESTDSSSTSGGHQKEQRKSQRMRRRFEYNNNNYNKRKVENIDPSAAEEQTSPRTQHNRRRLKTVNNNTLDQLTQKFHCPVCDREDFASLNVFETHLEEMHPEYQIKCEQCNLGFKNHRVLNLHRYMVHLNTNQNEHENQKSVVGFKDLTFVDFSSQKFPIIAKTMCEKTLHRASNENDLNFQCRKCTRGFPCTSALEIHQQTCLKDLNNYASSSDEEQNSNNQKDEEDIKRCDFFAGLNLQNKIQKEEYEEKPFTPKIRLKECLTKVDLSLKTNLNHTLHVPVDSTKDLADIQSIISVTSAQSLLQQLTAPKNTPPPTSNIGLPFPMQITPPDSNPRSHMPSSSQDSHQEEEQQDQFAAEFRKMKLRGEFPCRLCTAVFPNLRALKGHNRAHLTGNGNGPYRCNMCPHSSTDKAALVRHMRTHNGDRPYECSVCNYAFTTKANCERHLRNRHRKVTREEVKRSIIYHPSEDPTNDETLAASLKGFTPPRRNDEFSKLHLISEAKRALFTNSPVVDVPSTASSIQIPDIRSVMSKISLPNPDLSPLHLANSALSRTKEETLNLPNIVKNNLNALKEHRIFPKLSNALNLSNDSHKDDKTPPLLTPKIQVKNFNELKEISELDTPIKNEHTDSEPDDTYSTHSTLTSTPLSHFTRESRCTTAPIDLSMDVLDLSKKKRESTPEPETSYNHDDSSDELQPQDFTKKTLNQNYSNTPPLQPQVPTSFFEKTQLLLAQQLLKRGTTGASPGFPPNFYAAHLQNLYNSRSPIPSTPLSTPPQFGNIPPFGINPYLLQPHPFLTPSASPQDFQEMKERIQKEIIRGLQLSGGGLIMEHLASERLQAFQKQNDQKSDFLIKSEEKPLTIDTNETFNLDSNLRSPVKQPVSDQKTTENIISHTPNSVKMVIKNGVLMPKQKQRRYRTERPFSCEHCSARFTLRSNMERHVKQQHPQFWSQRQRSNMSSGVPGRKPSLQILPNIQPQTQSSFDSQNLNLLKNSSNTSKDIPPNFPLTNLNDLNKQPLLISDHVKFAILAQQLKQLQSNSEASKSSDVANDENINENDEEEENDTLVIDENSQQSTKNEDHKTSESETIKNDNLSTPLPQQNEQKKTLEQKMTELRLIKEKLLEKQQQEYIEKIKGETKTGEQNKEENQRNEDLVPVSKLLDNAAQIPFREYFRRDTEDTETPSEEDEEGLVASGSTSEGNISGSDGNRSESEVNSAKTCSAFSKQLNSTQQPDAPVKKKSAYSLAPNRVICPYCHRKFPWSSSLRRHILTHTGQKPFKCSHCPLLFTTKSNCDRHLLRKHGNLVNNNNSSNNNNNNNNNNNSSSTLNTTLASNQSGTTTQNNENDMLNLTLPTNYMMRNVPERPFKCSNCPSSTFSTLSNLKKHMSCKHNDATTGLHSKNEERPLGSIYDSHSSEDENVAAKVQVEKLIKNYQNDWEQQIHIAQNNNDSPTNITHITTQTQTNTDLPFKCHLCDSSYGERQDALDHIKEQHTTEYELLMSKGALDNQQQSDHQSNNMQHADQTNSDEQLTDDQINLRGKFPDYANRKVICAFCMRRFWSAEDLRRHMRTHTGERPFSCDVCRRRFTLKHSMLRHRKKHNNTDENFIAKNLIRTDNGTNESLNEMNENLKSNENNNNIVQTKSVSPHESDEREGGTDLISNLLGIRDSSIIDQVLRSSADDAAKLLGVNKSTE